MLLDVKLYLNVHQSAQEKANMSYTEHLWGVSFDAWRELNCWCQNELFEKKEDVGLCQRWLTFDVFYCWLCSFCVAAVSAHCGNVYIWGTLWCGLQTNWFQSLKASLMWLNQTDSSSLIVFVSLWGRVSPENHNCCLNVCFAYCCAGGGRTVSHTVSSFTFDLNSRVFSMLISSSVRLIFRTPSLHSCTIWGHSSNCHSAAVHCCFRTTPAAVSVKQEIWPKPELKNHWSFLKDLFFPPKLLLWFVQQQLP